MQDENQTTLRDQVIAWLNANHYTKASFERIISSVPGAATYYQLQDMVIRNSDIFHPIVIKGGLEGLALNTPVQSQNLMQHHLVEESEHTVLVGISAPVPSQVPSTAIYPTDDSWRDISHEEYREYLFRNDQVIRINNPLQLCIGAIVDGRIGGPNHFVTASDGMGHSVPAGWLHLSWKTKVGREIF